MDGRGRRALWGGVIATVLLGVVAAGMSAMALGRFGASQHTEPAPPPASATASAPATRAPAAPPSAAPVTVVVVGDSASSGPADQTWVSAASGVLGWTTVINLSGPGRGYLADPVTCTVPACGDEFALSIGEIARLRPDIVVTFGGNTDGDSDIAQAAQQYFTDLRAAAPHAKLIAVTPVTGSPVAPAWLQRHRTAIAEAAESVGAVLVDAGQPGLGDGMRLGPAAQAALARSIIEGVRRG